MTSCACSACASAAVLPGVLANRPGLSRIAYRAGTHGDFLAALLSGLSHADRPALSGLRTREPDDPTIALLDAFAVTCDVLTFYTERLANEAYLGTATERTSLQELGALVGHRLGRGAAAQTLLAFSLERPPLLPAATVQDPGVIPPAVPVALELPVGLRVQSVPGPGEQPQTFETVEAIQARPEWNSLPVVATAPHPPANGVTDVWLAGANLGLKVGDALLFTSADATAWDVRFLVDVVADQTAGRTHATWTPALDAFTAGPAQHVHAFRDRLSVFGHNAPLWAAMGGDFQAGYLHQPGHDPDYTGDEWPFFTATTGSDGAIVVDVEGSHPGIVPGSLVSISHSDGDAHRVLYTVTAATELSRSAFAVSGKATRLTLAGPSHPFGSPRDATVLAGAAPLQVVEAPEGSTLSVASLWVEGDASGMVAGRTVLLAGDGPDGRHVEPLVVEAAVGSGGRTKLTFTSAPTGKVARATAVVYGNVARATHGETVGQLLGSGDARVPFASARLAQGPLTFVPAPTPSGTASTLTVRVDDIAWSELPTTAIAGRRDRVFMTRDEPDGSISVVFGDGVHGARPSTGSNNLRATYRVGGGAGGNVGADALSMLVDRPLGLKGVTNPLAADGGVDPDPDERARRAIPVPVRTLGRVVSLLDYADFALAFTGVGKAAATVLALPSGATVVVTVADDDGLPPPPSTITRLDSELTRYGDPRARHLVVGVRPVDVRIALKVVVDATREAKAVLDAVEAALRARYSAPARAIGTPVHRSAVIADAAAVPGVVGVDLDLLYRDGGWPHLASRLVPAAPAVSGAAVVGAELLALSPDPFDHFGELT
jgi:predicted phage baseplate assembly protein